MGERPIEKRCIGLNAQEVMFIFHNLLCALCSSQCHCVIGHVGIARPDFPCLLSEDALKSCLISFIAGHGGKMLCSVTGPRTPHSSSFGSYAHARSVASPVAPPLPPPPPPTVFDRVALVSAFFCFCFLQLFCVLFQCHSYYSCC